MEELSVTLTPEMLALVPVVAAILQMVKRVPQVEQIKSWLPIASLGISLGLCYLTGMKDPILPAIIIGLVANGGYDILKRPKK